MTDVKHRAGATRAFPGARTVEHRFEVPLTPGDDRRIELFAREVRSAKHAGDDRPFLVQLNGGPGFPNQRPATPGAWLAQALEHHHVILLDQRGTGLSTPVTAQTLTGTPQEQAEYLTHFRADAIVRDAEHVRRALLGDRRWTSFGQSFGGLTSFTYLSQAPEGLEAAYVTGGIPPLDASIQDVYRATFARLEARIATYLDRYPEDRAVWERVGAHSRRLKRLGNDLGMQSGPERVHYLAEEALTPGGELSIVFLDHARRELDHTGHPLYAVLHEACWADGGATRWAAQAVLDERASDPLLHGEFVFPWDFEEEPSLVPFRAVAELLAEHEWPRLYDPEALARNEVPVTAAVYLEDMFVESRFSLDTAAAVPNVRTWVTNEHQHDGIHTGPVLERLMKMRRGEL